MQTIRDYVAAVLEIKSKLATAHLAAIDNFQATVSAASPTEAKPDFLGVIFKAGVQAAEKAASKAVEKVIGADVGPLIELFHAMLDEVDRAARAAESLGAAEWIKTLRSAVTNAYTQDQTGGELRKRLEEEYKQRDEGGRGGYIAGIQNELAGPQSVSSSNSVPKTQVLETAMYESWINQNFNGDSMDGTGFVCIQFADDGTLSAATIKAPLGDKVAGALNNVMAIAGKSRLMDLDVVKKTCMGDFCVCFEGNNVVRKHTLNDQAEAFLTSQTTWDKAKRFAPPA